MLHQIKSFLGLKQAMPKELFLIGYQEQGRWRKEPISLSQKDLLRHLLIVGSSGLGQDILFLEPIINKITQSFIFVEQTPHPKINFTGQRQEVMHFGLNNNQTNKFNWIPYCKDNPYWAYSIAEASLFTTNEETTGFHKGMLATFLAAIYAYTATLDDPIPSTTYSLISTNSSTQIVKVLRTSDSKVVYKFLPLVIAMDKTVIEAYLSEIKSNLAWFDYEQVDTFTDTTELIDFSRLRKEKIGVYVTNSDENIDLYYASKSLSRIILTCALNQLMQDSKGKPVHLFLSDLTDVGYFSYLHALPELSNKNIALITCSGMQVDSWLYYYGEIASKHILTDFHTKIFLAQTPYHEVTKFAQYIDAKLEESISEYAEPRLSKQLVLINGLEPLLLNPP